MIRNTLSWSAILVLSMLSVYAWGQSAKSLRINEVLLLNESSITDRYGNRGAWLEIYNTSAATVNLGGCFLSDDLSNPKKYAIPRGDIETVIPPRQHKIFWIDGTAERGTFHTNFEIDSEHGGTIALFDSDGQTLIDEVHIPSGLKVNESYARIEDGKGEFSPCYTPSPKSNNKLTISQGNTEFFKTHDKSGLVATIISMLVVFTSLILAYLIFKTIGKLAVQMVKKKSISEGASKEDADASIDSPGDVFAAIAMALYEHTNSYHDEESTIITINRVKRRYSPWSSKLHTLTERPQRQARHLPISPKK